MANYILSNKAVEDLSGIWNYSFNVWSEIQADKYYNLLIETCQELADGNISGKHFPEIDIKIFGLRTGQHIIFYQLIKNEKIKIVRILHSQMDLKNRMAE